MKSERKRDDMLCENCFRDRPESGPCPYCGWKKPLGNYPHALKPGSVLAGRYVIGRCLGQGGFGITYLAQDYRTKERIAMKEYFPECLASRAGTTEVRPSAGHQEDYSWGRQCFLQEAKTLAEFIGCPGVVRVYSYFSENGTAYFSMEYVEGVSMQAYLKARGPLSFYEALDLLRPVMEALACVHSRGIIHRDVAPDNIMILPDRSAKLLDFGSARYSIGDRTHSLDVMLKPGFAPKEQYSRHGKQGPYTDVYAMAATFYYAMVRKTPPESLERYDKDTLAAPSSLGVAIPKKAEAALLRGLAVRTEERFQTMQEFQSALEAGAGIRRPKIPMQREERTQPQSAAGKSTRGNALQNGPNTPDPGGNASHTGPTGADRSRNTGGSGSKREYPRWLPAAVIAGILLLLLLLDSVVI